MSHLVSRILLAVFLVPASALVYILTFCFAANNSFASYSETVACGASGVVTFVFVVCYWTRLWRKSVKWTSWRVWATIAETLFLALASASMAGFVDLLVPRSRGAFGIFCASIFLPTAWLIASVYVWRETPQERRARTTFASAHGVACPTCGYNLTGLTATRCPECGNQSTLDELFAAQTNPAGDDVA